MIDSDDWSGDGHGGASAWRRALDVFDDYDRGGALTEALADDLVNELACLGPRTRPGRPRHTGVRPGPQPSRPASTPIPLGPRPRLKLVDGGCQRSGSADTERPQLYSVVIRGVRVGGDPVTS